VNRFASRVPCRSSLGYPIAPGDLDVFGLLTKASFERVVSSSAGAEKVQQSESGDATIYNFVRESMKKSISSPWRFIPVCVLLLGMHAPGQRAPAAKSTSCSASLYHQFDFWIGDWDVFDYRGSTRTARVQVQAILDGCVLHETYTDDKGSQGESFTIYDSTRHRWHQTWVTNRGQLLVIEGALRDGAMVLEGSDIAPNGKHRRVRGSWKAEPEGVRETAVRSTDGGKNWQPWFDLTFRPHKPDGE
jgi:hypothetical protein